jgi:hypothetical protein
MKHRGGPQRLKQLGLRRLWRNRGQWSLRQRRRWKRELGDVAEYRQEGKMERAGTKEDKEKVQDDRR